MFKSKRLAYGAVTAAAIAILLGGRLAQPLFAQVKAALVRDVDNPTQQPVQLFLNYTPDVSHTVYTATYSVPAGKRFVLQQAVVYDYNAAGNDSSTIEVTATSGGGFGVWLRNFVQKSAAGSNQMGFVQGPLYADAGTTVYVKYYPVYALGSVGLSGTLVGYLVNFP
jgi:hypothetical protein